MEWDVRVVLCTANISSSYVYTDGLGHVAQGIDIPPEPNQIGRSDCRFRLRVPHQSRESVRSESAQLPERTHPSASAQVSYYISQSDAISFLLFDRHHHHHHQRKKLLHQFMFGDYSNDSSSWMAGETVTSTADEPGDLQLLLDDTTISSSNLGPRESDLLRSMSDDLLVSGDPIPMTDQDRYAYDLQSMMDRQRRTAALGNYRLPWYNY